MVEMDRAGGRRATRGNGVQLMGVQSNGRPKANNQIPVIIIRNINACRILSSSFSCLLSGIGHACSMRRTTNGRGTGRKRKRLYWQFTRPPTSSHDPSFPWHCSPPRPAPHLSKRLPSNHSIDNDMTTGSRLLTSSSIEQTTPSFLSSILAANCRNATNQPTQSLSVSLALRCHHHLSSKWYRL